MCFVELATLLQTQLAAVQGTHRAIAEVFTDLSAKQNELEGELIVNGKIYQAINEQSDTLVKTLSTFTDGLKTLVEKTIQVIIYSGIFPTIFSTNNFEQFFQQ